jgi:hypothetical protein
MSSIFGNDASSISGPVPGGQQHWDLRHYKDQLWLFDFVLEGVSVFIISIL